MAYKIYIRGVPEHPDVNVRDQPGLRGALVFTAPKEWQASCEEVRDDLDKITFQGQVYRWFRLKFADGRMGWVRDDLLDLEGDCSPFGYGSYPMRTIAFAAGRTVALPGGTVVVTTSVEVRPAAATTASTATAAAAATTTTTTGCDAAVRRDIRAKLRAEPSIASAQLGLLDPSTPVRVVAVEPGKDGLPFRWVRAQANGLEGYIREDLLAYSAECAALGLTAAVQSGGVVVGGQSASARFPTPVRGIYSVFQEFGVNRHKGADLAGATGLAVVATGNGVIAYVMKCARCRDNAPNFLSQGLSLWDAQAIRDPAWGYGFGNHVVVRYAWGDLPGATQIELSNQGVAGAYAYVVYAHLSRIDVSGGAAVSNGTQLGLLGNTGNSSGPHLHVEVRVSLAANENDLFNRLVINPRSLFQF